MAENTEKTVAAAEEKPAKKAAPKAAAEKKAVAEKKDVAEKKAAEKKPAEKKTAEKKPAEKKPAEKKPAEKKAAPKAAEAAAPKAAETPRLKKKYFDEVVPALKEQFKYENVMQVPRLEKVIINMGLGSEKENPKGIELAVKELGLIAGQKPIVTKAKKSVANFKVREGMNVGAKVTLRQDHMYYFADKFMNIVLPRVRDFRGVSDKSFDGRGNYALGVKEQLIFPEINFDDVDKIRGMNIVFVTSAKSDEEAKALLALLGMPFVQG